jgi:hypothetical protein
MKPILRLLVVLALAGGTVAAAPGPFGPCSYKCIDTSTSPSQIHTYSTSASKQQCCGGGVSCPPGMTLLYTAWGNPLQLCPFINPETL